MPADDPVTPAAKNAVNDTVIALDRVTRRYGTHPAIADISRLSAYARGMRK